MCVCTHVRVLDIQLGMKVMDSDTTKMVEIASL